jgi:hypothetical protein
MLNWQRSYIHFRTGKRAARLADLFPLCDGEDRALSRTFFERYRAGRGSGGLTAIRGIGEGPGLFADAPRLVAGRQRSGRLEDLLMEEWNGEEANVAVSGGIDSWIVAALLKSRGCSVKGWYLESGIPGYCERDAVLRMADALKIDCEFVHVNLDDFLAALPDFVAATEAPIYGLHPVSKLLFARTLARRGITSIVSGDGADQVMRWDWDCDLLPLTLTCVAAARVRLIAPFLSDGVLSQCREPSPDKAPVRELARRLGVPEVSKRPTVFPPIEGLDVLEQTTDLLLETLKERTPCAASPA